MRNSILTALLLILHLSASAQQITTSTFANASLEEVLLELESKSEYRFFYEQSWVQNPEVKISGSYSGTIETVLTDVLKRTDMNFFIDARNVILLKNRVIYSDLPDTYFLPPSKTALPEVVDKPIFEKEYQAPTPAAEPEQPLTLIGKQSKNSTKKTFTVTGYVRDSKTGQPIADVNVQVLKLRVGTVTDQNGFYKLDLPAGVSVIEAQTFSHRTMARKVVLYDDGKLNFQLAEVINQLDEVIINAAAKDNLKTATTGVIALDVEGIKTVPLVLGERDIFKVATTLPGIKTAGEGSAGYNVRGGKEDQNLILLDNAVLYNPAHFFGFFSAVNPFTVEKADIYKGSIPAEFGGRLSSVFDITTKSGSTEKFSGEGGIGPVTSNLTLGIPVIKGKSSLLVGGRATYSGWILRSLDEESLKNSSASFYDAIVKYSHKFNANNNVEGTFYLSNDAFSITSDSLYKYRNRLASFKWDHTFNEKHKGSLIITNSDYKFNIDYDSNNANAFEFGYNLNETQFQAKMGYMYSPKHRLSYGIASKLYNIDPGYFDPKRTESLLVPIEVATERGLESAVYIADNFKISDKLLLDVGVRYSLFAFLGESTQRVYQPGVPLSDDTVVAEKRFANNEIVKTYGGFEPRIAARYFLTKNFSVKASYDKTFQYMHLLSNNTTQSPTDTWKLSDLNVKPQHSQQFSLGLYKNFMGDDLEASIEGYYKKSENFLDYKVGAELLLNQNIETELLQGEGKAYGVELLLKKSVGKLNGWIGYTYSRTLVKLDSEFASERVNNGKYFAANFDKPHDVSLVLNYKFTKRYSFSTNFVYQTGRPITYPVGTYQYGGVEYTLYSDRNAFRIPDYYRLDLGINIEGNHKIKKFAHSFWNISVYNVLGRNNPYSVFFVTEQGEVKAYQSSIFSIPVPTVTYNFKF
ncbi:MAG TPA: TonB-dependent receptor [Flavobacterium sp.]|jgi:hypothetical protein